MTDLNKTRTIPNWLRMSETYDPPTDRETFILRTSKSLLKILSRFRQNDIRDSSISPETSILITFIYILLTALSPNLTIPSIILGYAVVRTAFMSGDQIRKIFGTTFISMVVSFLFLIPAFLMGYSATGILICTKVFITVYLLSILSQSYTINRIARGLRVFHIPSTVILILDITVKYIFILGNLCLQLLDALKLRSVGVNKHKQNSAAGILGITYLKSGKMAQETLDAMTCRGFDGNYQISRHKWKWKNSHLYDMMNILVCIGICVCYFMHI